MTVLACQKQCFSSPFCRFSTKFASRLFFLERMHDLQLFLHDLRRFWPSSQLKKCYLWRMRVLHKVNTSGVLVVTCLYCHNSCFFSGVPFAVLTIFSSNASLCLDFETFCGSLMLRFDEGRQAYRTGSETIDKKFKPKRCYSNMLLTSSTWTDMSLKRTILRQRWHSIGRAPSDKSQLMRFHQLSSLERLVQSLAFSDIL